MISRRDRSAVNVCSARQKGAGLYRFIARKRRQIIDTPRFTVGSDPPGGPVPKPRLKAYVNRTYNFPASSSCGIVTRISLAEMNLRVN